MPLAVLIGLLGGGACTTPPESDLIGGLPCDNGACAPGFECDQATARCVAPSAILPGGAGGTTGSGGVGDAGATGQRGSGGESAGGSPTEGSGGSLGVGGASGAGGRVANGGSASGGAPPNSGGAGAGSGADAGITDAGATCGDHRRNGAETAVDCGGPTCVPCAAGATCDINLDCASRRCRSADAGGSVCLAPTCADGILNGVETGTDCGGGAGCPSCADGAGCMVSGDCTNRHCVSGVCVAGSCLDGQRDANEAAVDCGGPSCLPCARGSDCRVGSDCVSGVCSRATGGGGRSTCALASCSDGVRNGTESDRDCGGGCSPCPSGKLCLEGGDCASGRCARVYSLMVCEP